jgi:hypothetical protein
MNLLYYALLIVYLICLCGSSIESKQVGLIVVPGLGRTDRLQTVVNNFKILAQNYMDTVDMRWDCVVYIYAGREVRSFWDNLQYLDYLGNICTLIEVPNQKVTQNLHMVQPALVRGSYSKVMILLDDCLISNKDTFDLSKILHIMDKNQITVASPMVRWVNIFAHHMTSHLTYVYFFNLFHAYCNSDY